ncbi:cation:proton antiporter [Pelotomaculum propionicicum]|uniref:Na(+)/H(+) antiporter NhaG n=1 Tax=Pelotomaculum propionicicum TaxID=258475 RepID=A0A4Y7RRK7_9FIRM|nr:cation:proton antiporter [Pelotomaculum propionicicum]NLI13636.1 sodium:proton antiporter [Peptococcaceae bacterium]TEB11349.1 Na(+)/H(+) antiporter NhaG [Pelotomaculum propionicicum]
MIIHNIQLIFILLALSVGVTALAKRLNKPYPIALVIIGAVVGLLPLGGVLEEIRNFFASDEVFRTAVISIFLPALLGEASLKLSHTEISQNRRPIVLLAFLGTVIAYVITGGLSHLALGLPVQTALVFGALMAATDPVSVISVFKNLGVNRRLAVIMEGESLVNDGVSVVLFKLSVYSLTFIFSLGIWGAAVGAAMFLKVVVGGTLVGLSLGFLISQVVRYFDDYPLENALSVVLFFGTYIIAEKIEVSGVIAVVAAGLVLGNYGKVIGMSPTTRFSISVFWDTIVLAANSLVFILVGLEISHINIIEHGLQILIATVLVVIGRSVAVYVATLGDKMPISYKHIINWGGLKGSLSLALALSLPLDFTGRETIIALTFSVVFFSLVVQGLTISPLIRVLGLQKTVSGLKEYEQLLFEFQQAAAAVAELNRLFKEGQVSPQIFNKIEKETAERILKVNQNLSALYDKYPELLQEQEFNARKKLLYAEHLSIEKLLSEGVLSEETGNERKYLVLEQIEAYDRNEIHNTKADTEDNSKD